MTIKLVALFLIAGCANLTPGATVHAPSGATEYLCASGANVLALYSGAEPWTATVTFDGKTATLTNEVSASGTRYADKAGGSNYVWRTKGNQAALYLNQEGQEALLVSDCIAQ